MIEEDLVECVIGLGPNLFYNSPMEACLLITRTNKPPERTGEILFINAVNEVRQDKTMGFLEDHHVDKIFKAYQKFEDKEHFASKVPIEEVLSKRGNMAISLYVQPEKVGDGILPFEQAYQQWEKSGDSLSASMNELFELLEK
jgi:type I restriction enzyme M protein